MIQIQEIGYEISKIQVPKLQQVLKNFSDKKLKSYAKSRDLPAQDGTSLLAPHLRFGTISVRQLLRKSHHVLKNSHEKKEALTILNIQTWVSELIWREFFMQILWHHPRVVDQCFRVEYEKLPWRKDKQAQVDFQKWCLGETGIPLVDAGMRELNATGMMHNRVRMVVASFLTKHLLIDWRWGEAYFAQKLLDYELASNNGNWQWCAGTGCDAAPFFRIFNPIEQQKKFDANFEYIKKWVPEINSSGYHPIIDLAEGRSRALRAFASLKK